MIAFSAAALLALAPSSSFFEREVAAHGLSLPAEHAWEPALVMDANWAIGVFNRRYRGLPLRRTGWAIYRRSDNQWVDEGLIPEPTSPLINNSVDASIASAGGNTFVITALAKEGTADRVVVSELSVSGMNPPQLAPFFSAWTATGEFGDHAIDKPWTIAGDGTNEYFTVFIDTPANQSPGYGYQRSTDGGQTWHPSSVADMAIKVDGSRVLGYFCAQSSLAPDGTYFIAYMKNQNAGTGPQEIHFVRGTDDNSTPSDPRVTFAALAGDPVVNLNRADCTSYCPSCYCAGVKTVPWIATDPTDSNRFYVVYHDTTTTSSTDVDVYCVAVTRPSSSGNLSTGSRVRVNHDPLGSAEADQFLPAATVDSNGMLHITFYDDRNYSQAEGCSGAQPQFKHDLYYCRSQNGGVSFAENAISRLVPPSPCEGAENAPAVDWSLTLNGNVPMEPGEYSGLAARVENGKICVYMLYTGTSDCDLPDDPMVIWFSRAQH